MSLTPTQLSELQTIVFDLGDNLPDSFDELWEAAIRIQKAGLGPVTGPGGQPAFDAAVADIVLTAEQIATVQGRQGGPGNSVQQAVFSVVPVEDNLPAGTPGGVIYLDTAPNTYAFTDVIELTPAGPNSVILSEVGTQVVRTVPAASGGLEVNNLATGAGFARVLTTDDLGGAGDVVGPAGATDNAVALFDGATGKLIKDSFTEMTFGANLNRTDFRNTASALIGTILIDSGTKNFDIILGGAMSGSAISLKPADGAGTARTAIQATTLFVNLYANNELAARTTTAGINLSADSGTDEARLGFFNNLLSAESGAINVDTVSNLMTIESDGDVQILVGGELAIDCNINNAVQLYTNNVETARTATLGNGGFQVNNTVTGGGFERVLTVSDLPTPAPIIAGTVDDQAIRWDSGNAQWEGAAEFGISDGVTGLENSTYLSKRINGAKYEIVGSLATRLTDKRGFFGFENSTLRMFVKNTTNSSDVAISARDNVGGGTDRLLGIFSPTGDTAIFGQVSGVRISSRTTQPVRFQIQNLDRVTVDDQGLNVIGNGTQSGVIDFTEGTGGFAAVAGIGQLFVFDNGGVQELTFRDDTGADFILNGGGGFDPTSNQTISGDWTFTGQVNINNPVDDLQLRPNVSLQLRNSADTATAFIQNLGPTLQFGIAGADFGSGVIDIGASWLRVKVNRTIVFDQQAANPSAPALGDGGIWVRNTSDGELIFTDDQGLDMNLSESLYSNGAEQARATLLGLDVRDTLKVGSIGSTTGVVKLGEQPNADVDEAGYGQIWVRNDAAVPALMYTDDSGNDYQVSGNFLSQKLAGSVLLANTTFAGVLNAGPKGSQYYQYMASFEVTADAADDIKVQLSMDTLGYFMGIVSWAGAGVTAGSEQLEAQNGDVVTNTVVIPTNGVVAQGGGTFVTIVGTYFNNGGTATFSLRVAKNADVGADGFIRIHSAHFLMPYGPQTNP